MGQPSLLSKLIQVKQSNTKENLSEQRKLRKPKKKAKENDGKY